MNKLIKHLSTSFLALMMVAFAGGLSGCDDKPSNKSPRGVLLKFGQALRDYNYQDFEEALTGKAFLQYGDTRRGNDRTGFDRLRAEAQAWGKLKVKTEIYLGSTVQVGMTVHAHEFIVAGDKGTIGKMRVRCEESVVTASIARGSSRTCRVSDIEIQ